MSKKPLKSASRKTCICCNTEQPQNNFYDNRNPFIHDSFAICKKCAKKSVDFGDLDTLMLFLQTSNIPYLKDFWKRANDAKTETLGTYLKNLNSLNQNTVLEFKDGDSISGRANEVELSTIEHKEFELTDSIIKRWGRDLPLDDYVFLEEEFERLGGYEVETTIQERLFKNMAKTQLMAEKAMAEGDVTKYEKMMKTLSSQMQDANIKPVQVKSASEDGGLRSWGEWIAHIEQDEPIIDEGNKYEPKYIANYINRWFITQMQRIFGKIKDEDIKK